MPIAITDEHQELASTVRGVLTSHKDRYRCVKATQLSKFEERPERRYRYVLR